MTTIRTGAAMVAPAALAGLRRKLWRQPWRRPWGNRGSGGGGGGGGGRGGRGRHPGHLKGREIGLWYAKKQGQKNKEAERQERAVVHMDERREEQIVQLLHSVQTKNDKDEEAQISWFAPEDHGYGTEAPAENKPNSVKNVEHQEKNDKSRKEAI